MNIKRLLKLAGAVLSLSLIGGTLAQKPQPPFVRMAELEIDPVQLEKYLAAVKEEMDTSVRVEPGVGDIRCSGKKQAHKAKVL